MRGLVAPLLCLLMCGCTTTADRARKQGFPVGSPSFFNADPDKYDNKIVYVTGYMMTAGHWWNFHMQDSGAEDVDPGACMNLENTEYLSTYRREFDRIRVTIRGRYRKGVFAGALSGCAYSVNGVFVDEDFLRKKFPNP